MSRTSSSSSPPARRVQLSDALGALKDRISRACAVAGRDPSELTVIAVTKYFPASDAALLADLGVSDLGENRDQEAAAKAAQVAELTDAPVRWHFVGQLQKNKARSVARYASAVHSVDRPELVSALDRAVARLDRSPLDVLIQLSLDDDPNRGGVAAADFAALCDEAAGAAHLNLAGLMAVAPMDADPDRAFARVAEFAATLRAEHPAATSVSAGMSGDLEAAVRHGATHLRIGTALLGRRPHTFG